MLCYITYIEKCSVDVYNVQIYNLVFFSVRNVYFSLRVSHFRGIPAFLLAKIDAKPEQTRYERFEKVTNTDW